LIVGQTTGDVVDREPFHERVFQKNVTVNIARRFIKSGILRMIRA